MALSAPIADVGTAMLKSERPRDWGELRGHPYREFLRVAYLVGGVVIAVVSSVATIGAID